MKIFNRSVRRKYHILETLEAGVVLSGAEVKSIRSGRASLAESFARVKDGEILLKNCYIYPYQGVSRDYNPLSDRKMLLHKRQIDYLRGRLSSGGLTLVPISLYSTRNMIKVELGLVASKKKYDHRRAIKERDEKRRIEQEMKASQ